MSATEKPLRADAARNRQAIICAAGSVFAERGTAVTLEYIAEVAGVGVGTIYRRFSSVDELVEVVLEEKMKHYADRAEAAAEHALHEPWPAFRDWILFVMEQQASDYAFSNVLLVGDSESELFHTDLRRTFVASQVLVERARTAGAIRPDFQHSDLLLLQTANAGVTQRTHHAAPDAWRRFAEYMLQAFQASEGGLPDPPVAWQEATTGQE